MDHGRIYSHYETDCVPCSPQSAHRWGLAVPGLGVEINHMLSFHQRIVYFQCLDRFDSLF